MADVNEILKKYCGKLSEGINEEYKSGDISKEYIHFKQDMMPQLSRYEKLAKTFSLLKLKMGKKSEERMKKNLDSAHLDLTPSDVATFSFFSAVMVFMLGLVIYVVVYMNTDELSGANGLFLALMFIASLFVFYFVYTSPERMANMWRLKAGSQMVPCILYIVVYMKHTSNLERAIHFASQNLKAPLSLDLKKIFWDVETGRFSTIKESLDNYLKTWEKYSIEFVEAFHLIESSLYESSELRRIQILEKSLQVILDGVYEKMQSFSREVRGPLTNVYMLGVVLPTLALALLPLASTLLGGVIKVYHVFILFNLIVPFLVFYMTNSIMLKRPGGHGESEILEMNPDYPKYKSKKPYFIAALFAVPLLIIGLMPLFFQWAWFVQTFNLAPDYNLGVLGGNFEGAVMFDYKNADLSSGSSIMTLAELNSAKNIAGPFGIGALILSLFVPLSVCLFFAISFSIKTKEMIKARKNTQELEKEFTNSLFQLGNRIGDGLPAEVAFARVAESTRGQRTAEFFRKVNLNLQQSGMSLENSIFHPRNGAIIFFPSQLIATSMKILVESVKKGLKIAAQSLMSISEYLKNINKVEDRMKDLLAEVTSDMKSNMVFLAPLLAGIVVGLAGMITSIINKLTLLIDSMASGQEIPGFGNISNIVNLFEITKMVPPYYLQIAIGIYLIEIIFILTKVLVTIDSGEDKLSTTNRIGKNLYTGLFLYFVVTLAAVITLYILATVSLGAIG